MAEYSRTGSIKLTINGELIAGNRVTATFVYTVGSEGIAPGGSIRIRTPNDGWGEPLAHRRQVPKGIEGRKFDMHDSTICTHNRCNLTVSWTTADSSARVALHAENGVGPLSQFMVATVVEGSFAHGDTITIVYGDTSWGEDGVPVPCVAPTPRDTFIVHVDTDGRGIYSPLEDESLAANISPGGVTRYNLVAPAIVRSGEQFELRIAGTDGFNNLSDDLWDGDLRLGSVQPDVALPGTARLGSDDHNHIVVSGLSSDTAGIHSFTAEPVLGGGRGKSNPVLVTDRDLHIYFGDLHCHSMYHGDGRSIGTPDELYDYGRNFAGLDFMAITDGRGWQGEGWEKTQSATNRHNDPGRFTTLKGYEYGYSRGHRNLIYRDCIIEPDLDFSTGFFEYYRGRTDVMSIPHHTKVRTDWDYFDPDLEPVVEAYSCWGSGVEHADPLWDKSEIKGGGVNGALDRGYRLGFIGSGDSHAGTPGRSYPQDRMWFMHHKSGYACVFAPELSRSAIFDAIQNRRCYATTGVRAILEFSVDTIGMGGVVHVDDPSRPRIIRVHCIGTEKLQSLRITKNGTEIASRPLDRQEEFFEYHDTSAAVEGDWYYVRIVQEDGNTIWSSPVWVELSK